MSSKYCTNSASVIVSGMATFTMDRHRQVFELALKLDRVKLGPSPRQAVRGLRESHGLEERFRAWLE